MIHRIVLALVCFALAGSGVSGDDPVPSPDRIADAWFLPFRTSDRRAWRTVRVRSAFGTGRASYVKGHRHSGTDVVPRKSTGPIGVFPVSSGVVCSIHLSEPHTTVVVRHRLPNGADLFSSYKHLTAVQVEIGQPVDPDTRLGRLFTRQEARALGGPYDHLHLEIRKSFDDGGRASWTTMTREDLDTRFFDPVQFLKPRLRVPPGLAPRVAERFVNAARELLGVPYRLGGRLRAAGEGIDCQGVLFYAAERIGRCGWKSFSTMPTRSVAWKELGERVPDLDPVGLPALDTRRLLPGDIILLLDESENPAEPSIGTIDGTPVWVWHTGIHTEGGKLLHADVFSGKVVEQDLEEYLAEYGYAGIFVTRMSAGPRPQRCRRGRRMPRPEPSP